MDIDHTTRLMDILTDLPMRRVLEAYGLPKDHPHYHRLSLSDFCAYHGVKVRDVLRELVACGVDEDDEEAIWLLVGT